MGLEPRGRAGQLTQTPTRWLGRSLGKATVYRLYPSKDILLGAYLDHLQAEILMLIDGDIERHRGRPAEAIRAIFDAIAEDVARPDFRGCPFNLNPPNSWADEVDCVGSPGFGAFRGDWVARGGDVGCRRCRPSVWVSVLGQG